MKRYIVQSLRLTLVLLVLLCVIYPLFIAMAGMFSPGKGGGEKVTINGRTVGYSNIGQTFNQPQYFWSRPSPVSYNAAGSAGSNKGPTNPDYLKDVQSRIDTILKYHPYLKKNSIPADMVTASGSGLDPDISPEAAKIQVKRVAANRNINEQVVAALVEEHTEKPLWGLFGPSKVNVLQLNIALDNISK